MWQLRLNKMSVDINDTQIHVDQKRPKYLCIESINQKTLNK